MSKSKAGSAGFGIFKLCGSTPEQAAEFSASETLRYKLHHLSFAWVLELRVPWMNNSVTPSNITAAALVMQFCLSVIATAGAYWIRYREHLEFRFYENPPGVGRYAWILLPYSLLTMGLLIFSDQFSSLWRPLSADISFGLVGWSRAIFLVLIMDITCFAVLVYLTGGSYRSPFTAVFFILPAMAYFLRESPRRVGVYLILIAAAFSAMLKVYETPRSEKLLPQGAYWLVSIACLFLSVLIGYITRPHRQAGSASESGTFRFCGFLRNSSGAPESGCWQVRFEK